MNGLFDKDEDPVLYEFGCPYAKTSIIPINEKFLVLHRCMLQESISKYFQEKYHPVCYEWSVIDCLHYIKQKSLEGEIKNE